MKIVVPIKQTFTTEAKIAIDGDKISDKGIKYVLNPYDEFALERALKAREAGDAKEIVLVTIGAPKSEEALRQGLAMGADSAYRVWDEGIETVCAWDRFAAILAAALEKLKPWDLILSGKVAVDDGAGIVLPRTAELLGIPQIHVVNKVDFESGKVVAVREMDGYREVVEAPLPALVTSDKSMGMPRYPTLPNIMKAKKKPLTVWSLADVGVEAGQPGLKRVGLSLPPAKSGAKMIEGEPEEAAKKLAELLHTEAKVI
jgi:electron transfer flavoprotein beta subunit